MNWEWRAVVKALNRAVIMNWELEGRMSKLSWRAVIMTQLFLLSKPSHTCHHGRNRFVVKALNRAVS